MLARVVLDEEELANFILESNKFKKDGGIDWRAFRPNRKDGQRSVYRVEGLANDIIALHGRVFVGSPNDKQILGWALITAGVVRAAVPLTVRADPPPPRHAAIESWPDAEQEQRTLAILLASKAKAVQAPAPTAT